MKDLREKGFYQVPEELLAAIQAEFDGDFCDDARAEEVMGRVYRDYGYLMDPHTASGWAAAETYREKTGSKNAMVVLSTASPYKFSTAVLTAIGGDTQGSEFERMDRLNAITGVPVPKPLAELRDKPQRHTDVISKDKMLDFVLSR